MSDFFDNDLELENEEKVEERPKKKNGFVKIIIYVVCVGVIAGGCYLANRFIPKKKDDTSSETENREISVLNENAEKVKTVKLENSKGTLELYSEKVEDEKNWYVEGVKKELISTSLSSVLVSTVTEISAIQKVTSMSVAECGLDKPYLTAEMQKTDNSVVGFAVGNDSALGDGCYLKIDGKDDIYLVDTSLKNDLDIDALALAAADNIPAVTKTDDTEDYFNEDSLTSCDSITVTGKNYPAPLVIEKNDDTQINEYVQYKISSPDDHLADNIDNLFSLFSSGVTADGAYSFYASDLSKFSLDSPDLNISMSIKNQVNTLKFSKQSDGYYAAWSNTGNFIYKVSETTVESVVNSKATDFYSSIVCLYSIADLSDFTVKTAEKSYTFGIKANSDEDADDRYIISLGNKKIDCASFQNLYQFIISLSCNDFQTVDTDSNDKMSFEFKRKDGSVTTVEFVKVDETRYQYSINGKATGKVQASKLNKIVKYTAKLANGEKIGELS